MKHGLKYEDIGSAGLTSTSAQSSWGDRILILKCVDYSLTTNQLDQIDWCGHDHTAVIALFLILRC